MARVKKRALAKATIRDFRVKHYIYKEPQNKWHRQSCRCGRCKIIEVTKDIVEKLGITFPPNPSYYT